MKRKVVKVVYRALLLLVCVLLCSSALAEDPVETAAARALQYAMGNSGNVQGWINRPLADTAGTSGEWYVMTLRKYMPQLEYATYGAVLERAAGDGTARSAATRLKLAMTLIACGCGDSPVVASILEETAGQGGVMGCIYTLHVLNSLGTDVTAAVETLLSLRLDDGGWAVRGTGADTDVTAMALQALAPVDDAAARAAVEEGLQLLAERQLADGGFSGFGAENCESTAQVLVALASLGVDPAQDERFIKNGHTVVDALLQYQLPSGGFCHEPGGTENGIATVQGFYALVAELCRRDGSGPLWVFQVSAGKGTPPLTFRTWAYIGIAAGTVLLCLVLLLLGRRRLKSYLPVLVFAVLLLAVNTFVKFSTPQQYYGSTAPKGETVGTVTLSIRCDTVAGRAEHLPADGVIFPAKAMSIAQGDTALSVLVDGAREAGITLDVRGGYVAGIASLYEFDFGDLSGWMYHVNGQEPSVYSSELVLQDGDQVEWLYTTSLGNDLK